MRAYVDGIGSDVGERLSRRIRNFCAAQTPAITNRAQWDFFVDGLTTVTLVAIVKALLKAILVFEGSKETDP